MKANFAVVRERLDGAEADYKALSDEVVAALKAQGSAVSFGFKKKPNTDLLLVYVDWTMPIPAAWGRRTAHVLYDVRSALDHLVHELYVASNGHRAPKDVAEMLAFPICDKQAAWMAASRQGGKRPSRLEGLDDRFRRVLRIHQPFRRAKARSRHALLRLRGFNDLDKHRRPYVVLFAPVDLEIAYRALAGCRIVNIEHYRLGHSVKVGTKLARLRLATVGESKECVGVHLKGQLKVALDRGVLVEDLLAKVIAEARWIVHDCEAVL